MDKLYKHYKNNCIYVFEKEVKIQKKDKWVDYVLYSNQEKNLFFLRKKNEFYEKFKEVK